MKEILAKDFDAETATGKVIIDFYGVGCINCRLLEPFLVELAQKHPEIKFVKVNVDTAPTLVRRFSITALPTILFVNNGKLIQQFIGLRPKNFWERAINDLFN